MCLLSFFLLVLCFALENLLHNDVDLCVSSSCTPSLPVLVILSFISLIPSFYSPQDHLYLLQSHNTTSFSFFVCLHSTLSQSLLSPRLFWNSLSWAAPCPPLALILLPCHLPGSPFRDEITLAILQLQENNRLEILKRRWWEGSQCPKEEDHRAKGELTASGRLLFLLHSNVPCNGFLTHCCNAANG